MNITVTKLVAVGLLAGATAALSAPGIAVAGPPVLHACVGDTVRTAARQPGQFGTVVSSIARDPEAGIHLGIGDDVNALAAGFVPDEDFPNSCNG
jgi:hypothetical protein